MAPGSVYVTADDVLDDTVSQTYIAGLAFAALGIDRFSISESHSIHASEVRATMRNGDLLLLSTIEWDDRYNCKHEAGRHTKRHKQRRDADP